MWAQKNLVFKKKKMQRGQMSFTTLINMHNIIKKFSVIVIYCNYYHDFSTKQKTMLIHLRAPDFNKSREHFTFCQCTHNKRMHEHDIEEFNLYDTLTYDIKFIFCFVCVSLKTTNCYVSLSLCGVGWRINCNNKRRKQWLHNFWSADLLAHFKMSVDFVWFVSKLIPFSKTFR